MEYGKHNENAAVSAISGIPEGKTWGSRNDTWFALVRRSADGGYQVDCGWIVRECHDDDYMSSTYHPFRDRQPHPWVGRRLECPDAGAAAAAYELYRGAAMAQRIPSDGIIIGSVLRG